MAECPQCGATNPSYAVYCGSCGQELTEEFRKRAAQEPTANDARLPGPVQDFSTPVRRVPRPVRSSSERLDVPRAVLTPVPPIFGTRESRRLGPNPNPMLGGTCAIAAGFLGIMQGIALIAGGSTLIDYSTTSSGLQILLGLVAIPFGFLSIVGGMDAHLRTKYKRSLTWAILGMVAYGFLIGAFLGLAAVILIAFSRDEFDGFGE